MTAGNLFRGKEEGGSKSQQEISFAAAAAKITFSLPPMAREKGVGRGKGKRIHWDLFICGGKDVIFVLTVGCEIMVVA